MKLYRIYTENKNKQQVIDALSKVLDGFTILEATGYWLGKDNTFQEASLVIERVGSIDDKKLVLALAKVVKSINNQESVMVTSQDVEVEFV